MGRLLKHRKKDNKWRLWTTISDGWLTDWLTEDEMKQYLAAEYEHDYKAKAIRELWTFPDGYYDTKVYIKNGRPISRRFNNSKAVQAFSDWQSKAFKGDYYEAVDKKFKELTEEAA